MSLTQNRPAANRAADFVYTNKVHVSANRLDFNELRHLTGDRLGRHDVSCPLCGPYRKRTTNQKRRVLRVYRLDQDFASFNCARCGAGGYRRSGRGSAKPLDQEKLVALKAWRDAADRHHTARQLGKARYLWASSVPIGGTPAETYLRQARGIDLDPPATLRFLPPSKPGHHPGLVCAFGLPSEDDPGRYTPLAPGDIKGVHLTLLRPDGLAKADTGGDPQKLMIGASNGWPLALIPANDNMALCIAEGVETGLSGVAASPMGLWVAASANRMSKLSEKVPSYVEVVTVVSDADEAGRKGARDLASAVSNRGMEALIVEVADAA